MPVQLRKRNECREDSRNRKCCHGAVIPECDTRPQREMNSYMQSFVPGDFILHFAGYWVAKELQVRCYAITYHIMVTQFKFLKRNLGYRTEAKQLAMERYAAQVAWLVRLEELRFRLPRIRHIVRNVVSPG